MAGLRFTPSTVVDASGSTSEGLYSVSSNWSANQVPATGDTAIIDHGTLDVVDTTIAGVSVFVFSHAGSTTPQLSLQNTRLGIGTTLVVDSRAPGTATPISVSSDFENDGTLDVLGPANLSSFAGSATIVNKGAVNLYNGVLNTSANIENDGTITIGNDALTLLASPISGQGSIVLKPGSNVVTEANVSSGQTFVFTGGAQGNSRLQLDSPSSFHSAITGFAASDQIAFVNSSPEIDTVGYVSTGTNSGVLQIAGPETKASIAFNGSYGISDFTVTSTRGRLTITTSRTDQGLPNDSPVYRFFDNSNGTHFFTSSAPERDQIVGSSSTLVYEGVGLTATDPNGSSATPVYRFFDSNYGTHFYTASVSERDDVIRTRSDLKFEGIAFYGDSSQQPGDSAVYRFFDTNYGSHFYTADATEAATIKVTRTDLKFEGISFYSAS